MSRPAQVPPCQAGYLTRAAGAGSYPSTHAADHAIYGQLIIYILGGAGEQRSRAQPARARAQRRRPCAAGERSEGAQRPSAGGRPKGGSAATQRRAACRRPLQDPGTRRSVGPEILPPVPPVRAQTDTASTEYFTSLRTGGLRPQQPARRDCPSSTSLLLPQALFFSNLSSSSNLHQTARR